MIVKRVFDCTVALLVLVGLSPVIIFVYIMVGLFLGFPVIFKQRRPGLKGCPFTMYKFRTMRDLKNASGDVLSDEERLTRFGRLLRKTSLDELPELVNVLKGEMSLVGPRPLLMEYLELYSSEQFRRHEVLPGITGLAQVSGRNNLEWEKRFDLDVWYVDHRNFWMDLKIIAKTIVKVLRSENVSQKGFSTATKFTGKKD